MCHQPYNKIPITQHMQSCLHPDTGLHFFYDHSQFAMKKVYPIVCSEVPCISIQRSSIETAARGEVSMMWVECNVWSDRLFGWHYIYSYTTIRLYYYNSSSSRKVNLIRSLFFCSRTSTVHTHTYMRIGSIWCSTWNMIPFFIILYVCAMHCCCSSYTSFHDPQTDVAHSYAGRLHQQKMTTIA